MINEEQRPLQWMDEEKECADINFSVEDNRTIGYNYYLLVDPTSNNNGSAEDYLIKPWEGWILKDKRRNDLETIDNGKKVNLVIMNCMVFLLFNFQVKAYALLPSWHLHLHLIWAKHLKISFSLLKHCTCSDTSYFSFLFSFFFFSFFSSPYWLSLGYLTSNALIAHIHWTEAMLGYIWSVQ